MEKKSPPGRVSGYVCVWLFVLLALANQSCKELENQNVPSEKASEKAFAMEDKMLSYNQFLNQVKGFEDKKLYNHFRSSAERTFRTSEKIEFPFPLLPSTTDSVRKISINNHTTYTIPIYRRSHTGKVFRNIIIDSTNTGIKAYLAWYFPDDKWIEEYKQDRKRSFYGRVILNDYSDLPSDKLINGRNNLIPVCASVMVLSGIVEHLCCHNSQHASCGCPGGSKYYIEYVYNTVTTCIDTYVDPLGGSPGGGSGGSGGGGGTVPNPGGGYDPCTGNGLRTSTTPCNPNPPNPGPAVAPNATVASLINVATSKGIAFTSTEIAVLNALGVPMITKIKDLISVFGNSVITDFNNLIKTLTGSALTPSEKNALDCLADNVDSYKFLMRLMYAANAYASQIYTGLKYSANVATCANCKANAFKHALFLIYNAETFTKQSAITLAAAHEEGFSGIDTEMDQKNNAAGASIFTQFSGSGTAAQWADRVKAATTSGQYGLVFVKNKALVSSKEVDPLCP